MGAGAASNGVRTSSWQLTLTARRGGFPGRRAEKSSQTVPLCFYYRPAKKIRAALVNVTHGMQVLLPVKVAVGGCKKAVLNKVKTGQQTSNATVSIWKGMNSCEVCLISRCKDERVESSQRVSFLPPQEKTLHRGGHLLGALVVQEQS